jgi:rhodanese-related sulfurtransferase
MTSRPTTAAVRFAAITLVVFAVVAGACSRKTSDRNLRWVTPTQALEESARSGGLLGRGTPRVVWLDPRQPAEFEKERIAGAVNLPFQEMPDHARSRLAGADLVVVYGTDHADPIAASASKRLVELGVRNVQTLQGGLRAWKRDGQVVEQGPAPQ